MGHNAKNSPSANVYVCHSKADIRFEQSCQRALKPRGLVHHIAQRLAGGEAAAVVEDNVEPAIIEVGAVARGVGGDQHVGR